MYFHVLYEFISFIRDRWVFRVTHHPGTIMHHPSGRLALTATCPSVHGSGCKRAVDDVDDVDVSPNWPCHAMPFDHQTWLGKSPKPWRFLAGRLGTSSIRRFSIAMFDYRRVPSGELTFGNGTSPFLMGKSTINGHFPLLCYFTRGYIDLSCKETEPAPSLS